MRNLIAIKTRGTGAQGCQCQILLVQIDIDASDQIVTISRRLCAPEYATVELLLQRKSYALAAACALVKYVEHANNVFYAPRSLKVEFQVSPL